MKEISEVMLMMMTSLASWLGFATTILEACSPTGA